MCLVCGGFSTSSWATYYEQYFVKPKDHKDSPLPLDEKSEVEFELAEALDQALLDDSDSDLDKDLVREMEEELARLVSFVTH